MAKAGKRSTIGVLLALHVLLGLYALSDVASKYAALSEPLSLTFFVCYGIVLVILFGYALGWQQIIKRMPLSSAYANRAVTIVWGIFWGAILFGESITVGKIVGALIIIAGIVIFAIADNPPEDDSADGIDQDKKSTSDATKRQLSNAHETAPESTCSQAQLSNEKGDM